MTEGSRKQVLAVCRRSGIQSASRVAGCKVLQVLREQARTQIKNKQSCISGVMVHKCLKDSRHMAHAVWRLTLAACCVAWEVAEHNTVASK